MINSTIRERLLATTVLVGAALIGINPAQAQEVAQADELAEEAIVVTGSRISRPNLEAASPVNVVTETEIQLRQPISAEALLRDLPGTRPALGSAINNGSNGSATIDLRGLNVNSGIRTLVLLNGRRVTPFTLDGSVDTNVIPVALVSRVDVLTGGASTVYGADAVAGVVNFVLKNDFSGVDFTTNYGLTERGDAQTFRADLTIGGNFAEGRGNAVLSMGYTNTDQLNQDEREFGQFARSSANGLPQGSNTGVPVFLTGPVFPGITDPVNGAVFNPATGTFRTPAQGDLFNFNPDNLYQSPQERYSIYGSARYEITPNIEAYSQGMFVLSKVKILSAASATFLLPFDIPLSNPFLPQTARNQLCGSTATFTSGTGQIFRPTLNAAGALTAPALTPAQCAAASVTTDPRSADYLEFASTPGRRFTEYGPRFTSFDTTTFQAMFGLRGDVFDGIKWDISAQYGETNQNQARLNWGSRSRVQQALRAVNTTTCSNTANGCIPLNLFGPEGSITGPMIGFFDLDAFIRRNVQQTVILGTLGGDLKFVQSPLAESPIAFSIGGEYRRLASGATPDQASSIQSEVLGTGARTPLDVGVITTKEIFGELAIPLIENRPFFQSLTAEGGVRYSDYTTTGGATTWKAGGSWVPVDGVKFRAMYQLAIRAPNIAELFGGQVQGLSNQAEDPCQGAVGISSGTRRELCLATGVPASSIGAVPAPSAGQINATTSGNPNLANEKGKTFTVGVVLTPNFLPGLQFTADYFNIRVRNAISTPNQADILNGCYTTALNPSQTFNGFCALIGRNPINGSLNGGGETPGVILGGSNLGTIRTTGIDFGLNYRFDLDAIGIGGDAGSITLASNATYLMAWDFQATPLAINRNCVGYYSVACTLPRNQVRANSRITYANGGFDLSLLHRYLSSNQIEPVAPTPRPPLQQSQTGGPALSTILDSYERIRAYHYFDLATAYRIGENLRINLTVNNLFDVQPPIVGNQVGGTAFNSGNTFPALYDVLGRSYTIGVNLRF